MEVSLKYTSNCFNCDAAFVLWRGRFRYHCRGCGNNFCSECLRKYCVLPQIGNDKETRVCDDCYRKYNEDQNQEDEPNIKEVEIDADVIDNSQLAIALSLSTIENHLHKYATSSDTTIMSEEEEIKYALRLSELEERAKQFASKLPVPTTTNEDEELALALAISKIETRDVEDKPKKEQPNKNKSSQIHCPICFEERLEYALVQCGHVVCGDCKPKLRECPICRAGISGSVRVYITD